MTKLVDKLKETIEKSGYSMKSSAAASQAASIKVIVTPLKMGSFRLP